MQQATMPLFSPQRASWWLSVTA